ncbi:MAG: NifB/NifX family molybdenum-iron cluster-binding protein [Chloroflexia bacterium]
MRVAISAGGNDLDAPVSPVFGRCPVYLFVDTETMEVEAVPNPAVSAAGGAGIQAAQFVARQGAQAVLSDNLGPNAFRVLAAAGIPVYRVSGGTVRQAVEAFKEGRLNPITGATTVAHAGMGWCRGPGSRMWRGRAVETATEPPAEAPSGASREELAALKAEVRSLQEQLNDLLRRLEQIT